MVILAVNASIMIIVIRDSIKRKQIETYAKHLFEYQMKHMLIAKMFWLYGRAIDVKNSYICSYLIAH